MTERFLRPAFTQQQGAEVERRIEEALVASFMGRIPGGKSQIDTAVTGVAEALPEGCLRARRCNVQNAIGELLNRAAVGARPRRHQPAHLGQHAFDDPLLQLHFIQTEQVGSPLEMPQALFVGLVPELRLAAGTMTFAFQVVELALP